MNKQQIIDILKGLVIAGGPLVAFLVNVLGMESGPAEKIVQGLAALVSIGGIVWLASGRTDRAMVVDAATVKGVQVHADAQNAPASVVAASHDPNLPDVVPMGPGGPVQ